MADATTEAMHFDAEMIEINVTIGEKKYILREASGDAAVRYRNGCLEGTKIGPEGKAIGYSKIADVEPRLVADCIWEVVEDDKGNILNYKPIQEAQVRKWSNKIQKGLFKRIKEISELDEASDESKKALLEQKAEIENQLLEIEEAEEKAKND